MTDARVLLERHKPRIVYDALESYFADSAAIWTDSPHNTLRRADGTVLAKPPKLRLEFLGPHTYEDKRPVLADDVIGETTRNYAAHAECVAPPGEVPRPRLRPRPARSRRPAVAPVLALLLLQRLPAARPAGQRRQARGRLGARAVPARSERAARAGRLHPAQARREPPVDRRPQGGSEHADGLRRPRLARELLPRRLALDGRVVGSGRRARAADHADARGAGGPDAGLGALAGLVGGHEGDGVAAGLGEPAQPGAAAALERPVVAGHAAAPARRRRRPRCSRRRRRA